MWENVKFYEEERNLLEQETRKTDECDMEKFGTLDSDNTIAVLGDKWLSLIHI